MSPAPRTAVAAGARVARAPAAEPLNLLALAAPAGAGRANYSCAALGAASLTLARAARAG
jgi:hypothetical protein